MPNFRETTPARTFNRTYVKHTQYKTPLRADFNKRCGYCNDHDLIQGGKRAYQIDHFVPMKPVDCIVTIASNVYSNLVYSCPFCNRAKWNKWPTRDQAIHNDGNIGFVDPCLTSYVTHFERSDEGEIIPLTELGEFMRREINLYLKRHAIIWKLEKLSKNINELQTLTNKMPDSSNKEALLNLLLEQNEFLAKLKIQNDG